MRMLGGWELLEGDWRIERAMQQGQSTRGVCLATVTTEGFLPGTLVMIASFLKAHPGFAGDVAVIHDGLADKSQRRLQALCDRMRFVAVSNGLKQRLQRLGAEHPRFIPILSHLYAFEAYRLAEYRKLLLCDGDLLFQQPIDELFSAEGALLCCGDWVCIRGGRRDAATFEPLAGTAAAGRAGTLERTFNDGLLLLDGSLLGEQTYTDLLALAKPQTWRNTTTPHFKQFLHNRHFAGRQTLLSSTYNYILGAAAAIREREGLAAADAKVLHFNINAKPWTPSSMLRWIDSETPVAEFGLWYGAWMECLSWAHLRASKRSNGWSVRPEA